MMQARARVAAVVVVAGLVALGCTGTLEGEPGGSAGVTNGNTGGSAPVGGSSGAGAQAGTASGNGGSSSGGSGSTASGGSGGSSGASGASGAPGEPAYLPAGIRRLTNEEYFASVRALLGVNELPAGISFPPDSRQAGFTRNREQRVDPVLVKQLDTAAQALADGARPNYPALTGCASGGEACAQSFIGAWGQKAYRRALTAEESSGLLELYQTAVNGGTHEDGIALVIRAMLQSSAFLYLTELGDGTAAAGDAFTLTPRELATSLAYYITAEPPPEALLSDADRGSVTVANADASRGVTSAVGTELPFTEAEALGVWARRLLADAEPAARRSIVRLVKEWLGVDRILETGKDTTAYPVFTDDYRKSLSQETTEFVNEIITNEGADLGMLLSADWSMVNATLARDDAYDLEGFPANTPGFVRLSLDSGLGTGMRRGILNQGAFLAVHAHASESAPILRGAALLRHIACADLGPVPDLSGVKPPDPPNPSATTRQRYDVHAESAKCAGCHAPIDALGFSFEHFDGAGIYRAQEGTLEVDSQTTVPDLGIGVSGEFADSGELALALAASPEVRACFARHLFRHASTLSSEAVRPSEDSFVSEWSENPEAEAGHMIESIVAYATSPLFAHRRAP
jgi:hypothetical protein